ncbi:MAG: CotS family spore coat protein [Lachnospiraceae bacterium]
MNDRAVSVLEKYDIEVLRSWKGRGAILCETKTGVKILKEYKGSSERLLLQQKLLHSIKEKGYTRIEGILPTREGDLLVRDEDMTAYYLKDYFPGKECNSKDLEDCEGAMRQLALYHLAAALPELAAECSPGSFSHIREMEKHNRELKRVRKYLKGKSQKTEFEMVLSKYYDFFQEKAANVASESSKMNQDKSKSDSRLFCHGDFQHHNLLFSGNHIFLINFEKFALDTPARDISLFFRKIMEKNGWSTVWGQRLLGAYEEYKPLTSAEKMDLYYRLSYPEKFWKIVNFYYNSGKAWIPAKNLEKLEKLLKQEEEKKQYLEENFMQWVLQ